MCPLLNQCIRSLSCSTGGAVAYDASTLRVRPLLHIKLRLLNPCCCWHKGAIPLATARNFDRKERCGSNSSTGIFL